MPIKEKIENIINLINQLNVSISNEVILEVDQVNFEINKVCLKDSSDLKYFIKQYKLLYEGNANIIKKIYCRQNIFIQYFKELLEKLKTDLNQIFLKNEEIKYDNFSNAQIGLNKEEISKLNKEINENINDYRKEQKKYFKEYKRRINEILDDILNYINLLISVDNNIHKLNQQFIQGYKEFHKSEEESFLKEETIPQGKFVIVNEFKKIMILLNSIVEIPSKVKNDEFRDDVFKKLKNINISLKDTKGLISRKINEIREKIGQKKIIFQYFDFFLKEMDNIYIDYKSLNNQMNEFYQYNKKEFKIMKYEENKIRLDILLIVDTTSSMEKYLINFKYQFNEMIKNINKNCPEALIYVGLIGYKDIKDKELGDDYIDIDFTVDYDVITRQIDGFEPDGGNDIPEDIVGAFELSLNKNWSGEVKIAFLITDSPCHGKKYHNLDQNQEDEKDDYINGDPDGKNIEDMIGQFINNNISLFCVNLHKNTTKMFELFKQKYNNNIENKGNCKFLLVEDNIYDKPNIEAISDIFYLNNKIHVEEFKKKIIHKD